MQIHALSLPEGSTVLAVGADRYQTDLVSTLLRENGVPFILKDEGSGDYMRTLGGRSLAGTAIIISKQDLPEALALLNEVNFDVAEDKSLVYVGDEDDTDYDDDTGQADYADAGTPF